MIMKFFSILITFSILIGSPQLSPNVANKDNPCNDSRYLKLKEIDLDEMSDREYQYFLKKDEACSNSKNIPINKIEQTQNILPTNPQQMMIYYQSEKISSVSAIALEWFLPTLGYAYAEKWGKGLIFAGLRLGTLIYAIDNYQPTEKGDLVGWTTEDCNEDIYICEPTNYQHFRYESYKKIHGNEDETNLLLALWAGLTIYQSFDLHKTVQKHNSDLYKNIFGKEPPSFSLNLQPAYQGVNLTLAYKFD